ncbi:TerD family protein [Dactylosporangium maewongense]|uniref:TerD family protein n=1 Tax=Dactylosporangium maewongense TaxID=634393 RepID=A0ABP4NPA9_9ACTN
MQRVLIARDLIAMPAPAPRTAPAAALATVTANIAHYGFALSARAYTMLSASGEDELRRWWAGVEPVLAALTGDDKRMADFVVYKNFPAEVLAMDEAEYWLRQILMYWGLPNELVTQEEATRAPLRDLPAPRVLHPADDATLPRILAGLHALPARWTDDQWRDVTDLTEGPVDLAGVSFVENRVRLAVRLLETGVEARVSTATDVLRLAAALSGGDPGLRAAQRLRRFTRAERRHLLGMMESAPHLLDDVARRREPFKRLLFALHPGDYRAAFPRVVAAYDALYTGRPVRGFASDVERLLAARDPAVAGLLATRPGEYARRLRQLLVTFGEAPGVGTVVRDLTTLRLLQLRRHLETVDARQWRMFPPRGNWSRAQVVAAGGDRLPAGPRDAVLAAIDAELTRRLAGTGPVALDPATEKVKLPTNDAELAPYGRGTVFGIPDEVRFVRSASYWATGPTVGNIWYDNSWNFFDDAWQPVGACCWDHNRFGDAAVFSGDPTNSKDLDGRACQLIDLYLDELAAAGVRYAVWSLLCYSRRSFESASDVHAALQWGSQPQEGRLFEPGRVQLSFPVRGGGLTKFVAHLDLSRRELVYLDANLPSRVHSASLNGALLAGTLPPYVEYLASLPSVHDLFRHAPAAGDGMPVRYDDTDAALTGGPAYVFRPSNQDSQFDPVDLGQVLASKGEAMVVLPSP